MAGLSNSIGDCNAREGAEPAEPNTAFAPAGGSPARLHHASDIECRPVARGEIESALRLILASETGLAGDEQVLDFCSFCVDRKIDTGAIWIATHHGSLVWAMLPVTSPGRTMLIFAPTVLFAQTPPAAIAMLSDVVAEHYAQRGVQLAQILIDPASRPSIDSLRNAGFVELTELVYLQKTLRRAVDHPALSAVLSLATYSPQAHGDFASVILRSYEGSQDCPALNGVRDMNDVIAGHRATGEFDPELWWVLRENQVPIATLLLSRLPQGTSIELVYLGLAPEARGRGIGDLLMQQAIATATREGKETLSLAVDSRNQPALRLYYRHGLQRIGSRVAMLRDLARDFPASALSVSRIETVQR